MKPLLLSLLLAFGGCVSASRRRGISQSRRMGSRSGTEHRAAPVQPAAGSSSSGECAAPATHHVMNQMGHDIPNLLGADTKGLDARVNRVVPGCMTMGATGMGDMHKMELPDNSISMLGGDGPFGLIDMGGMFTILKVRKQLTGAKDPGWYDHPAGPLPAKPAPQSSLATASRPELEYR
ncbi:MAG: hypothetical protein WKG01_00930 [Kofleriaceae bacterium]